MSKKLFSDDDDEALIENVRSYPVLYDHDHKDFRNINAKNNAWTKIGEAVGINPDQCKKRWKNIRDNYYKIYRKGKLSGGSGGASSSSYKWPLYEKLEFLSEVYRERPYFYSILQVESGNDEQVITDEEEENGIISHETPNEFMQDVDNQLTRSRRSLSTESDTSSACDARTAPKPKALKRRQANEIDQLDLKYFELLKRTASKKQDEDDVDLFMKSIAMSVKKLPTSLISKAKLEILTVVSQLEDNAFAGSSDSTTPTNNDAVTCKRRSVQRN